MSEKVTIKVERKKLHLPTIALRGLVVFPNNLVHFEVGREKSIAAVEWAMANNSNVFLVAQKSMDTTEPQQADLFSYGVVAEVKQVLRVSGDLVKVLVEGKYRAKLSALDASGDFLLSEVRPAPVRAGKADDAVETEALLRALKAGFDEYLGMNPRLGKDVVFAIVSSDDPAFLSEYMPANLLFRYEDKAAGRQKEIAGALEELRKQHSDFGAPDLAYLTGELMDDYLNDMEIIQRYAEANRQAIAKAILKAMHIVPQEQFTTVHNYIDHESMILRKGAVSAKKGERLIIPMNMRDGSLVCVGKGNDDWNQSAPHGAGRLMSRSKARESISLGAYRETMRNVHSSCISYDTIDEAPFAYKDMKEIMGCIGPTCDVLEIIKPIYNFKASS